MKKHIYYWGKKEITYKEYNKLMKLIETESIKYYRKKK